MSDKPWDFQKVMTGFTFIKDVQWVAGFFLDGALNNSPESLRFDTKQIPSLPETYRTKRSLLLMQSWNYLDAWFEELPQTLHTSGHHTGSLWAQI